ncbi:unnamed protein product [Boreogadus saida]
MAEITTIAALRSQLGEFHQLRLDDGRFQRYFRLTLAMYDDLLALVGARTSRQDNNYRLSISAAERCGELRSACPPSLCQ